MTQTTQPTQPKQQFKTTFKPEGKGNKAARLNVSIKQEHLNNFELYVRMCKELYGNDVTERQVMDQILGTFLANERDFHLWRKDKQKQTVQS